MDQKPPTGFFQQISQKVLRRFSNRQFLFLAAIVIAIWAGLTAVILKTIVYNLIVIIRELSATYSWIYFVTPLIGIFLTVIFVKYVIKDKLRPGTWHVLLAIAKRSSFLDRKETYSYAVSSALTV